jgi:acyl-CoA thioesterase FadM
MAVSAQRSLRFRALPFIDTDLTRMFTHSYASFMGLARWHLLFGSEFRAVALKNRWAPVTASEMINYRKSIRAWQTFELKTRILFWDDARFYVEHFFVLDETICARALVEGIVRGPEGILRPNDVFATLGFKEGPPSLEPMQLAEIENLKKLTAANTHF